MDNNDKHTMPMAEFNAKFGPAMATMDRGPVVNPENEKTVRKTRTSKKPRKQNHSPEPIV